MTTLLHAALACPTPMISAVDALYVSTVHKNTNEQHEDVLARGVKLKQKKKKIFFFFISHQEEEEASFGKKWRG